MASRVDDAYNSLSQSPIETRTKGIKTESVQIAAYANQMYCYCIQSSSLENSQWLVLWGFTTRWETGDEMLVVVPTACRIRP